MSMPLGQPPVEVTRLLCLGFGYTARALAHRLAPRCPAISGTSRHAEGLALLDRQGLTGVAWDGGAASPSLARAIAEASHILVSIPPSAQGDGVLEQLGALISAAPGIRWIGYLSTVGVYGDRGGAWVDETTPPAPASERSRRRLAAEEAWRTLVAPRGCNVQIFRLPGIYGPGRSAVDALRAGTARRILKPDQIFNRMHVADIAGALEAAMTGPPVHDLYCLADSEPAPPQDVVAFAAGLLGVPPPPLIPIEQASLSPMARSFYSESRRVSNRRMLSALGYVPMYPSYREGLVACRA